MNRRFKTTEQARKEYLKQYFFDNAMKSRAYYSNGDFSKQLSKDVQANINPVKDFYNVIDAVGDRLNSEIYVTDVNYQRQTNKIIDKFLKDLRDQTLSGAITPDNYTNILGYMYNVWAGAFSKMTRKPKEGLKLINDAIKNRIATSANLNEMIGQNVAPAILNMPTMEEIFDESKNVGSVPSRNLSIQNINLNNPSARNTLRLENELTNKTGTTGEVNADYMFNIGDSRFFEPGYIDLTQTGDQKRRTIEAKEQIEQGQKDSVHFSYGLPKDDYNNIVNILKQDEQKDLDNNMSVEEYRKVLEDNANKIRNKFQNFQGEKFVHDYLNSYSQKFSQKIYLDTQRNNFANSKEQKEADALANQRAISAALNSGLSNSNSDNAKIGVNDSEEPVPVARNMVEAQEIASMQRVPIEEQFQYQMAAYDFSDADRNFLQRIERGELPAISRYSKDEPETEESKKDNEEIEMENYKKEMIDQIPKLNAYSKMLNDMNINKDDLINIKSILSPEVIEHVISLANNIDLKKYDFNEYYDHFALSPEDRKKMTIEILNDVKNRLEENRTRNPMLWALKFKLNTSSADVEVVFKNFMSALEKKGIIASGKRKMKGAGFSNFSGMLHPVSALGTNKTYTSTYRTPRPAPAAMTATFSQPVSSYTVGGGSYLSQF